MNIVFKSVFLFSIMALTFCGCGNSKPSVKKGDKLIVQEELPRVNAETHWDGAFTDGFTGAIPKGTVLEVLLTPRVTSSIIEVKPVEVQGQKDAESVEAFFVPEYIRIKEGYQDYSFSISKEYLGSKVTISK